MKIIEFSHQLVGLRGELKSFTYRFTQNNEDAQDLLQETMLKALKYKSKFSPNTNLDSSFF